MILSQDQLQAFFEVARFRNFTKAADYLGLTQSALSHRIKKLEQELETSLFIRGHDGIRLTTAGDKLLQYTRVQDQIEKEFIHDLKTKANTHPSGVLKIGGISTLMWPVVIPALSKFLRTNPHIQMEMYAKEIDELPQLLQSSQVDMVITCGQLNKHSYEEIYLGDEINVLVQSKRFSSIPDVYLDHHPEDQTTINYLKIQNDQIPHLKRSYYDDIYGILMAVDQGLGQAIIPLHMLKHYKSLKVVKGERKLKVPIYLCFLKQPFYSKLHQATIDIIKQNIPLLLNSE
jgi:DNA-binding transcriptional LysR family regulator